MNTDSTAGQPEEPVASFTADRLHVTVWPDRASAGRTAGLAAAAALRQCLAAQPRARIMFASAPSQRELLAALRTAPDIDWARVTVFHMDEYVDLPPDAPQSFGRFLVDELFSTVQPGVVHLMRPEASPQEECRRYAELLREESLDLVCLGIGENGHLAFNDPPDADLHDPEAVKPVELSEASRKQQVTDGCFARLDQVPRQAITVTIPVLLSGRRLICTVPGASKRDAVHRTLTAPVDASCPATALRTHPRCELYLDVDAFGALESSHA